MRGLAIQDGSLGKIEHQLCPVGFVDSEVITNAVFLLAFATSPGAGWGIERLEAQLALSLELGAVASQFAAFRVDWKIHGKLWEHAYLAGTVYGVAEVAPRGALPSEHCLLQKLRSNNTFQLRLGLFQST